MDPFFQELGRSVATRWQEENFSLGVFPDIAQSLLEERPPAAHVDLPALIRKFLLEDEQPFQTQSPFGQPELVVNDDPRFYIQLLFWLEGTTEIHQHEFSGAFHVLAGSSIHSHFTFENAVPVSAHLRVGSLKIAGTRLLEMGDTVPITSGSGCIHSLFHLEMPSVTVVIRTHNDPGTSPQFSYLPPHLAIDPFASDALTKRRLELLDVLEKLGDPSYPKRVQEMLKALDFERGFYVLQNAMGHLRNIGAWEPAWKTFARKHRGLAAYVEPTLEEIIWRDGPVGLRNSITDPEHRFFLALLLNLPGRRELLELVDQRFPGKAVDTVMRWAQELSETSKFSTWILDAEFPVEVDIPRAKQPKLFFASLRHFLDGSPLKASPEEIGHLRSAFARSSLRALVTGD